VRDDARLVAAHEDFEKLLFAGQHAANEILVGSVCLALEIDELQSPAHSSEAGRIR
jgi:hypothetical protein